jgi:hypothetical protein
MTIALQTLNATMTLGSPGEHDRISIDIVESNWSDAVVELEYSMDNSNWRSFSAVVTFGVSTQSNNEVNVAGVNQLRLKVTTADTGSATTGAVSFRFFTARPVKTIPASVARFYVSATTGSFATTATVLPFNTTDASQAWASNSSGAITLDSGTYIIWADITVDEAAGNNRTEFGSHMQENSSGGYAEIVGTQRRSYSRLAVQGAQSVSISTVLTFGSSASVRAISQRISGTNTGEWLANGSSITILKLS